MHRHTKIVELKMVDDEAVYKNPLTCSARSQQEVMGKNTCRANVNEEIVNMVIFLKLKHSAFQTSLLLLNQN